jgi:hypothetical protein
MRRLVTRITAMVGVAVLAGCSFSFSTGGRDTLDPDKVEADIATHVRKQEPKLPVDRVACPEGVSRLRG